jgi:hypothetical protein
MSSPTTVQRRVGDERSECSEAELLDRQIAAAQEQLAVAREQLKAARRRVVGLEDAVATWEEFRRRLRVPGTGL